MGDSCNRIRATPRTNCATFFEQIRQSVSLSLARWAAPAFADIASELGKVGSCRILSVSGGWRAVVSLGGTGHSFPGRLLATRRDPPGRATHPGAAERVGPFGSARLGVVPNEPVEHLAHRFWIAAHDRGRGLDVADKIKVLPGEGESGVAGELSEEGTLRPPVTLAERMQGVDLAITARTSYRSRCISLTRCWRFRRTGGLIQLDPAVNAR